MKMFRYFLRHIQTELGKHEDLSFKLLTALATQKLDPKILSVLKKRGIGLLGVNRVIKIEIEAKFFQRNNETLIKKLNEKRLIGISPVRLDKSVIKKKILDILKQYPDGLPILEISHLVGSHRHTVTKYVNELESDGFIRVREIGPAKLCILNEKVDQK